MNDVPLNIPVQQYYHDLALERADLRRALASPRYNAKQKAAFELRIAALDEGLEAFEEKI